MAQDRQDSFVQTLELRSCHSFPILCVLHQLAVEYGVPTSQLHTVSLSHIIAIKSARKKL